MPGLPKKPARATPRKRKRGGRRLLRYLLLFTAVGVLALAAAGYYTYVSFAALIDARLQGERVRTLPRVHAR